MCQHTKYMSTDLIYFQGQDGAKGERGEDGEAGEAVSQNMQQSTFRSIKIMSAQSSHSASCCRDPQDLLVRTDLPALQERG